jgi:hypothetical protein
MGTLAKAALCGLYKYSGAMALEEALVHRAGRSRLAVLVFHRVTDEIAEDGLTVGTARFRAICDLLRRRFRVVPLGEVFRLVRGAPVPAGQARQARTGSGPAPRRTVAVTFDDCYRDNLPAARVLAEHGLPACFFIPTAYVGTDRVFPWDRHLKPLANLSWDEVRQIAGLGFEVGSHSVTHPDFATLTAAEARRELSESRAVLEERLGRRVRWFAYPFGGRNNFRPEWLPLLEEAGYEGAVSAYGRLVAPGDAAGVLPRVPAPAFKSLSHLELYLAGCLRWFYGAKDRVGLLKRVETVTTTAYVEHRGDASRPADPGGAARSAK